jgi:tetratricopeptide (TPR) repeat protein
MQSRSSTREGVEAAARLFQAAIAADSSYAPAHAALGNTYAQLFNLGYLTEHEALPRARAGAERALALDPNLADAHVLRSRVLRLEGKYQDAETALRRALGLNPGSGTAHSSYSGLLLELGRVDEALQEARRAVELDPLSTQTRIALLSRLLYTEQYDEGIAEAGKLLELEPNIADAYYYAAFGRSMKGDHARAIEQFRKAVELNPEDPYYQSGIAWAYARAGRRGEALEAVKKAERMKIPLKESAIVYAELGDLDRAYDYLERAYRTEPATLQSLKVDPSADALREDPRWNALARKLRF